MKRSTKIKPICKIKNCGVAMKARGLCDMHYKRMLKNGDPLIVARRGPKTNIFCYECGKPAKVKGYCRYHYRKMWANSRIKSFENDR